MRTFTSFGERFHCEHHLQPLCKTHSCHLIEGARLRGMVTKKKQSKYGKRNRKEICRPICFWSQRIWICTKSYVVFPRDTFTLLPTMNFVKAHYLATYVIFIWQLHYRAYSIERQVLFAYYNIDAEIFCWVLYYFRHATCDKLVDGMLMINHLRKLRGASRESSKYWKCERFSAYDLTFSNCNLQKVETARKDIVKLKWKWARDEDALARFPRCITVFMWFISTSAFDGSRAVLFRFSFPSRDRRRWRKCIEAGVSTSTWESVSRTVLCPGAVELVSRGVSAGRQLIEAAASWTHVCKSDWQFNFKPVWWWQRIILSCVNPFLRSVRTYGHKMQTNRS